MAHQARQEHPKGDAQRQAQDKQQQLVDRGEPQDAADAHTAADQRGSVSALPTGDDGRGENEKI